VRRSGRDGPPDVGYFGAAGSRGTGSRVQINAPVRAWYPRTAPEGISTRSLSLMAEPATTTSPTTVGAEVKWYWPGMR
jgi:hypothetical protein